MVVKIFKIYECVTIYFKNCECVNLPTQGPPLMFRITRPLQGKIETTIFLGINNNRKEFLCYLVVCLLFLEL